MNRKEIHFTIDCDGSIRSTIKGMKGSSCSTVAAEFEDLGHVTDQKPTTEFYESVDRRRVMMELKREV